MMSVTLHLDQEIEHRLYEESHRSGETLDVVANRLLGSVLTFTEPKSEPFVVRAFPLGIEERWPGLSASEILYKMDIEAYEEKLERTRHQSSSIRL